MNLREIIGGTPKPMTPMEKLKKMAEACAQPWDGVIVTVWGQRDYDRWRQAFIDNDIPFTEARDENGCDTMTSPGGVLTDKDGKRYFIQGGKFVLDPPPILEDIEPADD